MRMTNIRIRRAAQTRWLYRVETRAFGYNSYANRDRGIEELRKLAARVWQREAPKGRAFPSIKAGDGVMHGEHLTSYCAGFTEIVLCRTHRNILVLLHELTHALGPCQHGEAFVKLYFGLLNRWARFNMHFLQGVAAERGIVL
jgi:hypothetical protein